MLINVLITILLVLLNGFFVAAEFALVKVRGSQLELRAQTGNKLAVVALKMIGKLDAYLSATQLGITLASLGLGWIGEGVVSEIIIHIMHLLGFKGNEALAHSIALPISFAFNYYPAHCFRGIGAKIVGHSAARIYQPGGGLPHEIFLLRFPAGYLGAERVF